MTATIHIIPAGTGEPLCGAGHEMAIQDMDHREGLAVCELCVATGVFGQARELCHPTARHAAEAALVRARILPPDMTPAPAAPESFSDSEELTRALNLLDQVVDAYGGDSENALSDAMTEAGRYIVKTRRARIGRAQSAGAVEALPGRLHLDRIEGDLPAHYYDCARFNVSHSGMSDPCDCTATVDIKTVLTELADRRDRMDRSVANAHTIIRQALGGLNLLASDAQLDKAAGAVVRALKESGR